MSETDKPAQKVKARVLRGVRVRNSDKPELAALEMMTNKGSAFFLVTRESMLQIAEHLRKNAEIIKPSAPDAKH